MIGHQQIIKARRQKLKPSAIFVEVDVEIKPRYPFEHPENALKWGLYPTVFITNEEAGLPNDWRFVIGCRVLVSCPVLTNEVVELTEKLNAAGATAVYCCGTCDGLLLYCEKGEWHANS